MFSFKSLKAKKTSLGFINKKLYNSTQAGLPPKKTTGIKQLIAKYGYTSLATYLVIGGVDFALSYMLIHQVGEEKIYVKINELKKKFNFKSKNADEIREEFELKRKLQKEKQLDEHNEQIDSSLLGKFKYYGNLLLDNTMFKEVIIAYGLHKSLIFIRLPVTAMITPPIYKYLLRVRPSWVLKPQAFTKTVINPMVKTGIDKQKSKISWWRKIIG